MSMFIDMLSVECVPLGFSPRGHDALISSVCDMYGRLLWTVLSKMYLCIYSASMYSSIYIFVF